MLLIDWRNKCLWTLWKNKVRLIQRRHLPCFDLSLRSYRQLLSLFFGYLALGESRQDFVNIVCKPALIQTFITLFFYCKITSVNSLHENKFCRWICTQKRVLNVCFKDFWYTTNYSILFISFEIKKTHKNILFGHKESYTLI